MAHGRDVFGGADMAAGGREDYPSADRPSHDEEFDRRARYLAKAASLGHVVSEDEPADREH